jgi:hypothetical protein
LGHLEEDGLWKCRRVVRVVCARRINVTRSLGRGGWTRDIVLHVDLVLRVLEGNV